jgi:hypothetical protein
MEALVRIFATAKAGGGAARSHGGRMSAAAIITAALVALIAMTQSAWAEPNYFVWQIAHERMLAKWRHAEPRCGWTVGGYRCARRVAARYWYFQ